MADRPGFRNFDWFSLVLVVVLSGIGVATIYSTAPGMVARWSFPERQLVWAAFGLLILMGVALADYEVLSRLAYFLYGISIVLLVLVPFVGLEVFGARRWIRMGPVSLQPSEVAKVAVVLAVGRFLSGKGVDARRPRNVLIALLMSGVPMILIVKQPDLGTALVFFPVVVVMLYLAGVSRRALAVIILLVLLASPVAWLSLHDYQKTRLLVFLKPDLDPAGAGWAITQSKIAIGSGGFAGKGWLAGTQTHLRFLTASTRDFVFSTFAEEWGFVGCILLLALYATLVVRGVGTARLARDRLGTLISGGLAALLFVHVFVNIGMAMGILPVVGLPLPFLSYGGSALVSMIIAVGLIMSVRTHRFMFYA